VFIYTMTGYFTKGLNWFYYDNNNKDMVEVQIFPSCFFLEPVPNPDFTVFVLATQCSDICGPSLTCIALLSKEGNVISVLKGASIGRMQYFDVSYDMSVLLYGYEDSSTAFTEFYKIDGTELSLIVNLTFTTFPWREVPGGVLFYTGTETTLNYTKTYYSEVVDGTWYNFSLYGAPLIPPGNFFQGAKFFSL